MSVEITPERLIALTTRLCSIPSEASNELALAEVLYEELDRPGIDLHIQELVSGRANLIATVKGRGERAPLVLSGHLDAALDPNGWTSSPYVPEVIDGRIHAAGVDDMKGAVAAMAVALEVLAAEEPPPGDVILHAVMHHDTIGLGEKYALISEGPDEGFAICGEPSSLQINTSNAGALKFRVMFRGETAHISRAHEARDALKAAADAYGVVSRMRPEHEPHPRFPDLPLLHVGHLVAGTNGGKVAAQAYFDGDVRTVPGMNRHDLKRQLRAQVDAVRPMDIDVDIRITAVQTPFLGPTRGRLIDAVAKAHRAQRGEEVTIGTSLPTEAFVTDASDLARAGLETIVYGPGDWHFGPNQNVAVSELVDAATIYADVARQM